MKRRGFLLALAAFPALRAWAAGQAGASQERGTAFAPVLPGRQLVFPRDHGAHPDFRTEWWYATGWLKLADGSPLGFQITFFRVRTGIGEDNPSAFAPRQLLLAHAAIADPRHGRLRHDQRSARSGFGRATYAQETTDVRVGDWRFALVGDAYRAEVRGEEFAYALNLRPDAPPLLNGKAGFSVKAPDPRHASYYYSRPQLAVSGTLSLDGRAQPVSGSAWLDHEWSSELLPTAAQGWDWIGINLDDGGALMAFRLRDHRQGTLWAAATLRAAASARGPNAGERDDPADGAGLRAPTAEILAPEAVEFVPLRHWRSPRTGIDYPVEWRIRVGRRSFRLLPLLDDQELDSRRSTGAIYWEGSVRLQEEGKEVGRGYLEMTGYGERIRVG